MLRMKRILPVAAALVVGALLGSSCSSGGDDKTVAACDLVTPKDISAAVGETMQKTGGAGPVCNYVNPATRHTVSITMRSAGSASDAKTQLDAAASALGDTKPLKEVGDSA